MIASSGASALKRLTTKGQSKALLFGLLAIAFGLLALTTITANLMPMAGWLSFLVSLLFLVLGARSWDSGCRPTLQGSKVPHWEKAAMVVITLVAAYMRFSGFTELPFASGMTKE